MTNAERTKLIERTQTLNIRIHDLTRLLPNPSVLDIMNEYADEVNRLDKLIHNKREYMYNFKSGGWNTATGYTVEEAIEQARNRWADNDSLAIDEKSFRESDPESMRAALSLFY
jgi:hypothetical protein